MKSWKKRKNCKMLTTYKELNNKKMFKKVSFQNNCKYRIIL